MKGAKVTRRKTLCKLKDLLNIAQNDLVLFISVSVNLFFFNWLWRDLYFTQSSISSVQLREVLKSLRNQEMSKKHEKNVKVPARRIQLRLQRTPQKQSIESRKRQVLERVQQVLSKQQQVSSLQDSVAVLLTSKILVPGIHLFLFTTIFVYEGSYKKKQIISFWWVWIFYYPVLYLFNCQLFLSLFFK